MSPRRTAASVLPILVPSVLVAACSARVLTFEPTDGGAPPGSTPPGASDGGPGGNGDGSSPGDRDAGPTIGIGTSLGCATTSSFPEDSGPIVFEGGTPVTLVSGDYVQGITADGAHVYWTSAQGGNKGGAVLEMPLGGGAITTLASAGLVGPFAIAVDATNAYFTDGFVGGGVIEVPLGGGTPVTLFAAPPGLPVLQSQQPWSVAVDAKNVYWTIQEDSFQTIGNHSPIQAVPIDGGTPTTLAFSTCGSGAVATDGVDVFFTDCGSLMKVPTTGGTVVTMALEASSSGFGGVTLDANNVYWVSAGCGGYTGAVYSTPRAGGTVVTLASNQAPNGIAVDATNVYWSNAPPGMGTIMSVPIAGGTPVTLAVDPGPGALAVTPTALYWTSELDHTGSVKMLSLK
jgi:hypothetical protein